MKITKEVLEGYLNCKLKGHLKLAGESGSKSGLVQSRVTDSPATPPRSGLW